MGFFSSGGRVVSEVLNLKDSQLMPQSAFRQTVKRSLRKVGHRSRIRWQFYFRPRADKQPLFILARQRTGGNLLADYLTSIPGLSLEHEFLNPVFHYGIRPRPENAAALFRHVRYSLNALPGRLAGCKILIGQFALHGITFEEFHAQFPTSKYLVLYRRETDKQFVSLKVAHATKQYLATEKDSLKQVTVRVDPEEISEFYERNKDEYESVMRAPFIPQAARVVCYEDLAARPQELFDEVICPFLDLPPTEIETKLVKQARRPISETVENYDEVQEVLQKYGTFDLQQSVCA